MLHGRTQDICTVSFSITHANQMHTGLCTHTFSAHAHLILTVAQLVKMASKVEEAEILFREHVLKIPEKEALMVHQVGA